MQYSKRKVFIDDDANSIICACGCLFVNKYSKKLLLIQYLDTNKRLDDLGGKVDHIDNTKYDTIFREVDEESNGLINKQIISKLLLSNNYFECYSNKSKYFFLVIEVDDSFFPDTTVFGRNELCENINRVIEWHDITTVLKNRNLANRLLCTGMLNYLKNICKMHI